MYGLPREWALNRCLVRIKPEKCVGCYNCILRCPIGVIKMSNDGVAYISEEGLCAGCMKCLGLCPSGAIIVIKLRA